MNLRGIIRKSRMAKLFPTMDWYYRIQGKPELLEKLSGITNKDVVGLLANPVLWVYSERAFSLRRITLGTIEVQMKLLFLANLSHLYLSHNNDADIVQPLRALLGDPPIKIEIFDQWWSIERYRDSEYLSDVPDEIASETLKLLAETGNDFIDGWLKNLIAQKEASEKSN